jgi:hypothetical protein
MSLSIYYIGFVLFSIFAVLSITREGKKYNHFSLIFVSSIMILFAGLRDGSPDQKDYRNIFYNVASLDEVIIGNDNYHEIHGEWGYLFLNSLIKFFFNNDVILFLLLALLTIGIVAYSCRRLSPYPLVSMLCYYSWFYYSNLGGLRQALATSLFLLMILMFSKNQKILATSVYLVSGFVHKVGLSAILIGLAHIVVKWRILLVLTLLTSIVISVTGVINKSNLDLILPFISDELGKRLLFYADSELWGKAEGVLRGSVLKQSGIILISYIYRDTLKNKFPVFPTLFYTYVIGFMIIILFQDFKIIADRLSNVFTIAEIILIPMLLSLISGKEKIIAFCMLIQVLLFQVYKLMGDQLYPYKFVLL